ncbi:MAG: homoserine O-succinyltransferase, partial [Bacteroidaceae bacterium]
FYVTGHSEYRSNTLHVEYVRDIQKGKSIAMPQNYYVDDDPSKGINVTWRSHGTLLFANWLNYFVYQASPYNINEID